MTDTARRGKSRLRRRTTVIRRALRSGAYTSWVLAVPVGTAAGYASLAFREGALGVQAMVFGSDGEHLYEAAASLPAWQILLVPTLGGLLVGLFIHFMMPERRGRGVADVMEAVAFRGGLIRARVAIGAALASAASIGVGASVGREGPVVHMGAAIGAFLARRLGLNRVNRVTLLGCGVAAAVSASFNAPIAGVFFALEVVIGQYALHTFAPIVVASVLGTIVSRIHFGEFPAFIVPEHAIASFWEFPAFALLGVCAATGAVALLRGIVVSDRASRALPVPGWARPAGAGLLLGGIALFYPHVLGVGYGATDAALSGQFPLTLLLGLIIAKIAATAICLGGGFGGGIFSPSLFIGAMMGGAFGIIATMVFPEHSSGHGAYTLIGMGALAGAVLGAPISTILIVFELTSDFELTVAVMLAVVIAAALTRVFQPKSFFVWQLYDRGVELKGGLSKALISRLTVGRVMRENHVTVGLDTPLADVRAALDRTRYGEIFVTGDTGRLIGTVRADDIRNVDPGRVATAGDIALIDPDVITPESGVDAAIGLIRASGEEQLPVVADRTSMRLVGIVRLVDLYMRYNRILLRARSEVRGEN